LTNLLARLTAILAPFGTPNQTAVWRKANASVAIR
jgi:hypothetical protein